MRLAAGARLTLVRCPVLHHLRRAGSRLRGRQWTESQALVAAEPTVYRPMSAAAWNLLSQSPPSRLLLWRAVQSPAAVLLTMLIVFSPDHWQLAQGRPGCQT